MKADTILILDFGSQFTQLIARRIRELNVFSEIHPFNHIPDNLENYKGIVLSGSPCSVNDENAPDIPLEIFDCGLPVLGLCYGAQLMALKHGGKVSASDHREYGRAPLGFHKDSTIFEGTRQHSVVWMSHGDAITILPKVFEVLAETENGLLAAFQYLDKPIYGLQFHPEVTHTEEGKTFIKNFVVDVCKCDQSWTPDNFVQSSVAEIRERVGQDKVIMGLSGGVDSTVAAKLIHEAIGDHLYCIFIDNGLLRKNEYHLVLEAYKELGLNIIPIDAGSRFLSELSGVSDPETKRKIIGRVFVEVFEEESKKVENAKWLGQGTIYPDVIESVSVKGPSATIKSHHNVGGLPENMALKVLEPINTLFKDEVRRVGTSLELPKAILQRHPFPGPGLAIRIVDDITSEKVRILQEADDIFIGNLKSFELYDKVWQAGAIFLPVRSVGVMGDERTYQNVICLRAVTSVDGMTADWADLPRDFLVKTSNDIINKVKGINRVVYDISSKPPATIEWE
ncbi:MAG: glutamine-hydrolyzing GMP synthase [Flavobacteriales bacterium]|nr:glutamine-hydrolyzing GMP synthase [Flavobacteriales bacterium]